MSIGARVELTDIDLPREVVLREILAPYAGTLAHWLERDEHNVLRFVFHPFESIVAAGVALSTAERERLLALFRIDA